MKAKLACLLLLLPLAAWAAHEFKGVEFEDTARQASGATLPLKGLTEVSHNYLPFYAAALYAGQGKPDARQLAMGQVPCRIELRWPGRGLSQATISSFHSRWMPPLIRSFIRS